MEIAALMFKALSEEIRLRILALLTNGERCVCDLMASLDLPQSTVSRHLTTLKNAGLVFGRRSGKWMYYRLADPDDELRRAVNCIIYGPLLDTVQAHTDADKLARHLMGKSNKDVDICA